MPALLRSRKDLPEWYPLATYTKNLSEEEWFEELILRYGFKEALTRGTKSSEVLEGFQSAVINGKRGNGGFFEEVRQPHEIWGVWGMSAFDMMYIAAAMLNSEKARVLLKNIQHRRSEGKIEHLMAFRENEFSASREESFGDYIDWDNEPFLVSDIVPRFPMSIDLDQDDETLKAAFSNWLIHSRQGDKLARRQFDERDFRKWKKYRVLAVFDLQFWALLTDCKYTDSLIANTLWPNEDVNTTERFRKVVRPLCETLFEDWSNIARLGRQIELKKLLRNVAKKKNKNVDF